jgi:hypothetical protein
MRMMIAFAMLTADPSFRQNARLGIDDGQLGLCVFAGVAFAGLSYAVYLVKGRSLTYYASQFIGIGFILLAVVFLLLKMVSISN